jgi:HTH-type transcriptional regulator, sugar sensing transcriptional regulator
MTEPTAQAGALAESLKSLGLTKYEALVYIALLQASGATATRIHELSGVPRASVYPVLERLSQKQLVTVSNTSPKRFNPMCPDKAIEILLLSVENDAARAKKVLNRIYAQSSRIDRGDQELIWAIHGDDHIRARVLEILQEAEESIRIIFYWDHLRAELIGRLLSLKKEAKVEIITDSWDGPVPDQINVVVKAPPNVTPKETVTDWLAGGVFIIDQRMAMVVMGSDDKGYTALYSESVGFVRFFTMYWNFFSNWG